VSELFIKCYKKCIQFEGRYFEKEKNWRACRVIWFWIKKISLETFQSAYVVPSWSCSQVVSTPVWHIPLLCVQWKTPDDGQRNCPKHAEFHSKNKFEKLVHLIGFIIRNLWYGSKSFKISSLFYWHFGLRLQFCT
jgi:hypothetical protein